MFSTQICIRMTWGVFIKFFNFFKFSNNSHLDCIPSPLKQYLERYYSKKRAASVSHGDTQLQMVHNVSGSKWKKYVFYSWLYKKVKVFYFIEWRWHKIIIEMCKIFLKISRGKTLLNMNTTDKTMWSHKYVNQDYILSSTLVAKNNDREWGKR